MTEIRNHDSPAEVAEAAAANAVELLQQAIELRGSANWVLAGGSSPMLAYKKLVKDYSDALDWSLVTVIMGDERMVPLSHKDSNLGAIVKEFDKNELMTKVQRIIPNTLLSAEDAAREYEASIHEAGILAFDLVWIGVGEDGHTLSLFPGNDALVLPTEQWVVPVHDAPKLPADRISLSLKAMEYIDELVIFAVGASKREVLREARLKGKLPIAVVANAVETNGGEVRWLYDDAAWESKP